MVEGVLTRAGDMDQTGSPIHTGPSAEGEHMPTAFEELMTVRGRGMPEPGEVTLEGTDPVLSTRFRIGETCAAALGGVGVAVSDLWELKTGRRQKASVDVRQAAAGLRSTSYLRRPGPDGAFAPIVNEDQEVM